MLGADIGCSSIKYVKPVKRGLKRKLIPNKIEFNNDLVIARMATDSKNTEDGLSSNKPVAKKRKVTRKPKTKPVVTRNRKNCAQG